MQKLDARVGMELNIFCTRADTSRTRYVAKLHFLVGNSRIMTASNNSSQLAFLPSRDFEEA